MGSACKTTAGKHSVFGNVLFMFHTVSLPLLNQGCRKYEKKYENQRETRL